MLLATKPLPHLSRRQGFTIVELLIVIVVIGILAAITIIAYNGVTQHAHVAVLESDLSNAAQQLGIDNVNNGSYPATAAQSNNGAGLKASPGTVFTYTTTSGTSYCLAGTNSGVSYVVTNTSNVPTTGTCATVPTSVITLAGNGTAGFADGAGASAEFNSPEGVTVDAAGNVYVADLSNERIRAITPAGVVSTLAGNGTAGYIDGAAASAEFQSPFALAIDASGDVYVADLSNERIREITPAGVVSTLAGNGTAGFVDGAGASAEFRSPSGLAVDASGNLYVADYGNERIRKITPAGAVSTLAGNGTYGFADGAGASAEFRAPAGLVLDASGNVYVADYGNNRIRKITPAGVVSTLAGNGTAGFVDGTLSSAEFNVPLGIAVDASGHTYVADTNNNRIREIK